MVPGDLRRHLPRNGVRGRRLQVWPRLRGAGPAAPRLLRSLGSGSSAGGGAAAHQPLIPPGHTAPAAPERPSPARPGPSVKMLTIRS